MCRGGAGGGASGAIGQSAQAAEGVQAATYYKGGNAGVSALHCRQAGFGDS